MGDVGTYAPSPSLEACWEQRTGMAFDPVVAAAHLRTRTTNCPKCTTPVKICT